MSRFCAFLSAVVLWCGTDLEQPGVGIWRSWRLWRFPWRRPRRLPWWRVWGLSWRFRWLSRRLRGLPWLWRLPLSGMGGLFLSMAEGASTAAMGGFYGGRGIYGGMGGFHGGNEAFYGGMAASMAAMAALHRSGFYGGMGGFHGGPVASTAAWGRVSTVVTGLSRRYWRFPRRDGRFSTAGWPGLHGGDRPVSPRWARPASPPTAGRPVSTAWAGLSPSGQCQSSHYRAAAGSYPYNGYGCSYPDYGYGYGYPAYSYGYPAYGVPLWRDGFATIAFREEPAKGGLFRRRANRTGRVFVNSLIRGDHHAVDRHGTDMDVRDCHDCERRRWFWRDRRPRADHAGGDGSRDEWAGDTMCRMDEHIDGQLAYLRTGSITEAQTPQWNVFANTFRADKEKNARLCRATENEESRAKMMSASLPESLGMMAARLMVRLELLRAMEAAIQPLYSILSKEQKRPLTRS